MAFQRENQRISASDVLQELARGEQVRLLGCTISGDLDVNRLFVQDEGFDTSDLSVETSGGAKKLTFTQSLTFDSCTFEGDVCFAPPWESPESLSVRFEKDVVFNSSKFCGQSRFSGASFGALSGFDGCGFDRVASFRNAVFCGRAMYRTAAFDGYGLFNGAVFETDARFTNTCFGKGGNFTNVRFKGRTDFAGVYSKSKSVPVYESVRFSRRCYGDDETFWRFIKQSAQDAGHYQLAGESFYNERCAHFWRRFRGPAFGDLSIWRKGLRVLQGVRLVPELVFGRLLFGYGERPTRVLVASALIIFACAMFYSSDHASLLYRLETESQLQNFGDGLYFSTITFTTLGFGDMYPDRTDVLTRYVTMAESISGACLMALFVVSLSKRYSRG